jgi:hypothetical protein
MMTLKEYARHRKCSPAAVRKALETGRISGDRDESGWRIDSNKADADWERNTSSVPRNKKGTTKPAGVGNPDMEGDHEKVAPIHAAKTQTIDEQPGWKIPSYNKSLEKEKHYKALLAEIEYQIEIGALVRKADNDKAIFNFHRSIRDRLLNIPDRIAAVLAGETDRETVHGILTKELRQALTELAGEAEAVV